LSTVAPNLSEDEKLSPLSAEITQTRFSMLRRAPGLLLIAIAVADMLRVASTDLYGHIRFGQMFLNQGHLLPVNPFGYSAPGYRWLHHEWLSQTVFAWVYSVGGVIGLKTLKFACSAGAITFLAMSTAETGATISEQFPVILAIAIALSPTIQFRPQMFDFAAFAALLALLARDCYRRSSRMWLAVPLFALWSNLHGAFVIGLAAMGAYAGAAGLEDFVKGSGLTRGLKLSALVVVCGAASLLNPIGIEEWKTILVTLRTPVTSKVMADFAPLLSRLPHGVPDIIEVYATLALLTILACATLVLMKPYAGDLALVAVAALTSAAAFAAIRNVGFAMLAVAPLVARRIAILRVDHGHSREVSDRGSKWIIEASFSVVLLAGTGIFSARLPVGFGSPRGALAFMDAHAMTGNILNDFKWGQALIWFVGDRDRIFLDGRFDLAYPVDVISDYMHFQDGDDDALRVLNSYPHDYVLISAALPGYRFMIGQPGWVLVYQDSDASLFARADSTAAKIPGAPIEEPAPSHDFP